MAYDFVGKEQYTCDDLVAIMAALRAPDGCPWDREQTHESIRANLLEETHEAIDAINRKNMADMCEELGDILLQIVFHAEMARYERDGFTFDDVADGICKKLIKRHPHVFGDTVVGSSAEVLQNWNAIKRATKNEKNTAGTTQADLMRSLPATLPALMRAAKVQSRAKQVGFDWTEVSGAWSALEEETAELKRAIDRGETAEIEDELGDLLFSAVNVSRFVDTDAEHALQSATDKFIRRFEKVEEMAKNEGIDMTKAGLEQMDLLWEKAKKE